MVDERWKEEARRYAENADYWRGQAEAAREVVEATRANRHAVQNWRASPSGALEQVVLATEDATDRALSHYDEVTG